MTSELSEDQIQKIVKNYVQEALNDDESERINGKPLTQEGLEGNLHVYDSFLSDYREALALRDNRPIEHLVNTVLKEADIDISQDSFAYRKLCREMLKAQIGVLEKLKNRELGDYSDDTGQVTVTQAEPQKEPPGIPLTQLVDDYFNENLRAGKWSPRTIREYENSYRMLKESLGEDKPVNYIDHKIMQEYKKLLLKLPPNVFKSKKYEGMSLRDFLKIDSNESNTNSLSVSAINRYIMNAEAVFRYGVRNGHMKMNPAEGLKLPKQKRPQEERQAFNNDDLHKIFHSKHYYEDTLK
jgi:hypothetical protein